MNFIRFLIIYPFIFSIPLNAESILKQSGILTRSEECFKDLQYEFCNLLVIQMERIQENELKKNRYKCQSSILGLQTELIQAYNFDKTINSKKGIMIPYVIKNC